MNRLKMLREKNNLTVMQFVDEIRQIAPTMTATQWIVYENKGINQYNDKFWQIIADYFGVDLGYLYGYQPEPIIRELYAEIEFLRDENRCLNKDLTDELTITEIFRRELHCKSENTNV
ncbi:TPA: helix-turn-helix transcriptional regulator [Streptococcus agalactiae]|nr:helix-turn-helix transcriptional regulator [Streptococcus agalactiae]